MNLKIFILIILFFESLISKAQFSGDLSCNPDTVTFAINKVWEFDDENVVSISDTIQFNNKTFFKHWSIRDSTSNKYFSDDKDGNLFILSKDKKKSFLIIPKNEIPDYKINFDGQHFVIKSYHVSIKTPYCIYDDLIMIEGLRFKEYYKKGVGFVFSDGGQGDKVYLKNVYYKKTDMINKK